MLAKKLSARRRSIGMSIDQLVEASGIPKGTVTKVLTGASKNPALETVKAIAYAMGMTLDDLTENESDSLKHPYVSERALRIAALYDATTSQGRELFDSIATFIEKNF